MDTKTHFKVFQITGGRQTDTQTNFEHLKPSEFSKYILKKNYKNEDEISSLQIWKTHCEIKV